MGLLVRHLLAMEAQAIRRNELVSSERVSSERVTRDRASSIVFQVIVSQSIAWVSGMLRGWMRALNLREYP